MLPSWPSCLGGAAISSCARGRRARPDAHMHAGGAAAALGWGSTPAPAWCWGWELSGRARSGPPAWLCLAAPLSPNHSLSPQESASGCGGASTISSNPTALSSARSPKKAPFCFPLPNQGGRKSEWETKEAKRNLSERPPQCWRKGLGWPLQLPG